MGNMTILLPLFMWIAGFMVGVGITSFLYEDCKKGKKGKRKK